MYETNAANSRCNTYPSLNYGTKARYLVAQFVRERMHSRLPFLPGPLIGVIHSEMPLGLRLVITRVYNGNYEVRILFPIERHDHQMR